MSHSYVLLAAGPNVVGLRGSIESWMRGTGAIAGTNFRMLGDSEGSVFVRAEFTCAANRKTLEASWCTVAAQWGLTAWHIQTASTPRTADVAKPRLLVLVSKADHCLRELLALQGKGALPGLIAAAAGNHTDLQHDFEQAGIRSRTSRGRRRPWTAWDMRPRTSSCYSS
ncbi:hypothetical protein AB0A63_31360 [Lentzea sp. NPDC042327]|uniref:hypothetical protein n=1 Tax=Lentzea sp. NPDC042327 TaxID=3154801 RepID=UPI003408D3CB